MVGFDDDPLVPGRRAAAARIEAALQRAVAGTPTVVLVDGEAGLGKSLLLRHVIAGLAPDLRVLRATGEEAEQRLDYGVIEQLWAEAEAMGLRESRPFVRGDRRPDPLDVGAALLESVQRGTAGAPLVVVLDDAQWFDRPSLQSIVFALRRVRAEPVLTVIASRPGSPTLDPLYRLCQDRAAEQVALLPLAPDDIRELARQRGVVISDRATARLHAHSRGNPLEASMLIDELGPEVIAGGFGPLPAPRSFATVMLGWLAGCPAEVQRVVSAVAVLTQPVPIHTLARMLDAPSVAAEVDDGVARGLLSVQTRSGRRVIDCGHPLVRASLLEDLPIAVLADLHDRAATVVEDPTRRMLHRLAALDRDDPALLAEATALADERVAGGWDLTAAELLVSVANVCPDGADRNAALVTAADALARLGDVPAATGLLAEVPAAHRGAHDALVRGQLAFLQGDFVSADAQLTAAWDGAAGDARIAAQAACTLGALAANSMDAATALAWARRSLEIGAADGVQVGTALTLLVSTWALHGDLEAGDAEISSWLERTGPTGPLDDAEVAFAMMSLWRGRFIEATEHLHRVLDRGGTSSALTISTTRYQLADAYYRMGRWGDALAIAEDLAADLDDTDQLVASTMAHSIASFVLAGRGQWQAAERHLAQATSASGASGDLASGLWLVVGAARLAVARGDTAAVVENLQPLAAMMDHLALPEGAQPWRADLVEALVACGRLDEARVALDTLEARHHAGNAHASVGVQRVRAQLAAAVGDDERAAATFDDALAADPDRPGAFVRARLELAAGAFHRRRGQRRVAADLARTARARFAAIGAQPFVERAEQELLSCGLAPRPRSPGADRALTPAETAVAERVAQGMSNREVAADLVVSVKTVESHLSRVFAKLQVPHRTALAATWPTLTSERAAATAD